MPGIHVLRKLTGTPAPDEKSPASSYKAGAVIDHGFFRRWLGRLSGRKSRAEAPSASTHIASIDGLRALAITGVLAYHTRPKLMSGGFLGVTIFFVISGFLITSSVERRLHSPFGFHYGRYLWGKIRRLAIPVLALIALTAFILYALAPGLLGKFQRDALPSALFVGNIAYIVRKVSYFASAGLPSPLTHLWFVAVMMQFYVLWPLLLWFMHRLRCNHAVIMVLTVFLAYVSATLMTLLYSNPNGRTRVYYGLDTRLSELMIGAVLALAMRWSDRETTVRGKSLSSAIKPFWGVAGLCLCAAVVVLYFSATGDDTLLDDGGYQAVAILVGILLFIIHEPTNWCSCLLGSAPLRYIGSRAFSLYLVHYPLLEMMNPARRTSRPTWWQWIAQGIVIWVAAELFHRFVEGASAIGRKRPCGSAGTIGPTARILAAAGIVVTLVVSAGPGFVGTAARSRSETLQRETASLETRFGITLVPSADERPSLDRAEVPVPSVNLPPRLVPQAQKVPENINTMPWSYDAASGVCNANPLIISDSVEMGAHDWVQRHIPASVQDNLVGRPFSAGPELFNAHKAAGQAGSVVVVALGTNGPIASEAQVEQVVKAVHGEPLYFTTIRAPLDWQDGNNRVLRAVAARHRNVGILDWYGVSADHPEYLYDDGTHLTARTGGGREAFGQMIRRGLCGQ